MEGLGLTPMQSVPMVVTDHSVDGCGSHAVSACSPESHNVVSLDCPTFPHDTMPDDSHATQLQTIRHLVGRLMNWTCLVLELILGSMF